MAKTPPETDANSEGHYVGFDADGELYRDLTVERRRMSEQHGTQVTMKVAVCSLLREAINARNEKHKATEGRKK